MTDPKSWLRQNQKWLAIIACAFIVYITGDGIIDSIGYHAGIMKSKAEVKLYESRIRLSKKRVEKALADAVRWENAANIKDGQIQAIKVDIEKEKILRKQAEAKIAIMTITEVVIQTRAILETSEIVEQTQGIVFSLSAGKKNLIYLEGGFSLAKNYKKLEEVFSLSERKSLDLEKAIVKFKEAIIEKDFIIGGEKIIGENWKQAFNLSEARNKKAFKKGLTWGAVATGAAIVAWEIFVRR
jgi:hypothetical protein